MSKLRVGQIVQAKVIEVASHGVTVESNGKSGFIQIPELSWDLFDLQNRVSRICKVDDILQVKVIALSDEQFYASLKQVNPGFNPWSDKNKVKINQEIQGEIVVVAEYGYLVKLSNLAIALMPLNSSGKRYLIGDKIKVKVIYADYGKQKVTVEATCSS
jgi:ribosomal protein S1